MLSGKKLDELIQMYLIFKNLFAKFIPLHAPDNAEAIYICETSLVFGFFKVHGEVCVYTADDLCWLGF